MANTMVLFLHGVRGSSEGTWGQFRPLFLADAQLKDADIGFYQYKTPLIPILSKPLPIQDLASALRTEINNRYLEYGRIVLICHSLGGLIARKYVIEEIKSGRKSKVTDVVLFATPHLGADVAWWAAKFFPRQILFAQLSRNSDALQSINNDWAKLKCEDAVRAKYVRGGQDFFVDPLSAAGSPGVEVEFIQDRGHSNLVKPTDCHDLGYLIVRNVILAGQQSDRSLRPTSTKAEPAQDNGSRPPVLFEFYKPEYEAHYLRRRADALAEGYLRFQNIWI